MRLSSRSSVSRLLVLLPTAIFLPALLAGGATAAPAEAGPAEPIVLAPTWSVPGLQPDARLGSSTASAGDVNGDGFDDLIVGAPGFDDPAGAGTEEGAAFLYLGSAAGLSTTAAWSAFGLQRFFGDAVASAGDVNGDGIDDLIVGEPGFVGGPFNAPLGQAYVFLGSAAGPSTAPDWSALGSLDLNDFGAAVASAGDVNGDGFADVIVGGPLFGSAYVFHGSASGPSAAPDWTATGAQSYTSRFGESVGTAGDVNGDGFDDVIIGEPGYYPGCENAGRASVYLGSAAGVSPAPAWIVEGQVNCLAIQGASLGASVSTAGDVNLDGYDDVVVGDSTRREVMVYPGSAAGLATTPAWTVSMPGFSLTAFGDSVAGGGDVNGDGRTDIIVGAPRDDRGQADEGSVFIYLNSPTGLDDSPTYVMEGDQDDARLGSSVAFAGDPDGDGLDNVIVGAPLYDDPAPDAGAAFLFLGPTVVPCAEDQDLDLYCSSGPGQDCNDLDASIYPNAPELCNDIDDDCDGDIDEDFDTGSDCITGIGACAVAGTIICDGSGGAICDAPAPGLPTLEICDGLDNDCNGLIDEDLPDSCAILSIGEAMTSTGDSVANAGDVNGDGYDDFVAGAPEVGEGRAYVVYGSSSADIGTPDWSVDGTQVTTTPGVRARFGESVAGAGDVNGDGFDDFLVGSPDYDYRQIQSSIDGSRGAVYVYLGSLAGPVFGTRIANSPHGAYLGRSVTGLGDLNGDGFDDFAAGAPADGITNAVGLDHVRVFLGGTGFPLTEIFISRPTGTGAFGRSVAGGGDLNGDGNRDLLVGTGSREAFAFFGSGSGIATIPGWTVEEPSISNFGGQVASAGDVNGDGFDDVLIGGSAFPSRSYLYLGSASGPAVVAAWSEAVGSVVADAGDVNGDGLGDVLIGDPGFADTHTSQGRALLFLGSPGGLLSAPFWTSSPILQEGARYGASVSTARGFDGLPHDDLLIGSPGFDPGQTPRAGRVDVILSSSFDFGCNDGDGDGFGFPGNTSCSAGAAADCDDGNPLVNPAAIEICDGIDNDCDGVVDLAIQATCTATPTTLNINGQGGGFDIDSTLIDLCTADDVDADLLGPAYISRVSTPSLGTIPLPTPNSAPGCNSLSEDGLWENFSARKVFGHGGIRMSFNRPSDGNCETLDGNRQDLIAVIRDAVDGETATVCFAAAYTGNRTAECCSTVRIISRGSR